MFSRLALAAGLALAAAVPTVNAQQATPRPVEFYFDADALTVRPFLADGETPAVDKLTRMIERKPTLMVERGELAQYAMRTGQAAVGSDLYRGALARIDETNATWRRLMWNYGWDLHRAGDTAAALAQFQRLAAARGGSTGSWVPPTLALSLWANGRQAEAVQWYAAAVRTEPNQWRTTAQYARLLPAWRPADRDMLAQVHAAWVANPPRWP